MANATADNLLDDLNLTQADYNLGSTLSRLGCKSITLPRSHSSDMAYAALSYSLDRRTPISNGRKEAWSRRLGTDADLYFLCDGLRS
jgi:hypothetical protein